MGIMYLVVRHFIKGSIGQIIVSLAVGGLVYFDSKSPDIVLRILLVVSLKIYLVNMAEVYNYQKALKQDIVIRKISDEYSLPVGVLV